MTGIASATRRAESAWRTTEVRQPRPANRGSACLTSLKRLLDSDLEFHGAPGKHATHGWHPFPARFPPQLPRLFIEALTSPGETVLDPMAGSGTTLVEAHRVGRRAIGCDIDPLARLIASARLAGVDSQEAARSGSEILRRAERDYHERRRTVAEELRRRFDPPTRAFLDYWFAAPQQLELFAIVRHIEAEPDDSMRRFLQVVFSSTIIAKSGGLSLARDLAHTRPHRAPEKKPGSAFAAFAKRLSQNLSTAGPALLPAPAPAPSRRLHSGSGLLAAPAQETGLPSESVDLIVTSPPYANGAIDYMRAHKFSLVWFGWSVRDLTCLRGRYLGHDAKGAAPTAALPDRCERTLAALRQRDDRKAAVLRRYFSEMSAVIAEMERVLRSERPAVMVVGTSVLRGLDVETHESLAAIAESKGFRLVGLGVRRLDRDRRMMPARWSGRSASPIEARMHEEYVIGLVKP